MAKTLDEIAALDKTMLIATDIAPYLECDAGYLRWIAQREPNKIGFPVITIGDHVKFPKAAFLFWCQYGRPVIVLKDDETIRFKDETTA